MIFSYLYSRKFFFLFLSATCISIVVPTLNTSMSVVFRPVSKSKAFFRLNFNFQFWYIFVKTKKCTHFWYTMKFGKYALFRVSKAPIFKFRGTLSKSIVFDSNIKWGKTTLQYALAGGFAVCTICTYSDVLVTVSYTSNFCHQILL